MIVDLFLVYQFIKRLATPFNEWEAYKLGIIDENGNLLKKKKDFTKVKERQAFGHFDLMVSKLKKLLEKVPGGKTRIASYAAALWLIKENAEIESQANTLTEEQMQDKLNDYMSIVESHFDLDSLFENAFDEEAPANSVGSGNVAGVGVGPDGEPGLTTSQMKKHKKRKPLKRFGDVLKDN